MTTPAPVTPRMLDERSAAAYLGIGRTTFRRCVKHGRVPAPLRTGRRVLWDRILLDRHIDALSGIGGGDSGGNSWDDV